MIVQNEIELFKDLTSFSFEDRWIDLHNNFICTELNFENKNLQLFFQSDDNRKDNFLFSFESTTITKMFIKNENYHDVGVINMLYRGRFEDGGNIRELSLRNEMFFYLEFEQGNKCEFFAMKLVISSQQ